MDSTKADTVASVELAILSRTGGREYNEDACGHWHDGPHLCCVVADGAGGHSGGEVAARLVVSHLIERFAAAPLSHPEDVSALLRETNHAVLRQQASEPALARMHSTVAGLFIDTERGQALWGHSGDTRLYLFRQGQMLARTRDHSLVQSLLDAGALRPEQMLSHPRRCELLSALGCPSEELMVTSIGRPWHLAPGDAFLLCTDGLWEFADDAALASTLARASSPQHWLAQLEQLVLRCAALQGKARHDNFSGIAVWIGEQPASASAPL